MLIFSVPFEGAEICPKPSLAACLRKEIEMKVIVCGGRSFRSPAQVWRGLDEIHSERPITQLMHGGANGVDRFAREWAAKKPTIKRYVCHAQWDKHGRKAGPIRNKHMLNWKPDLVIAFPGGAGTADMVKQARSAGVIVLFPDTHHR